ERADRCDARSQIIDFRYRKRHVVEAEARRGLPDINQAVFVAVDQRTEQDAADDAEDGGIGAYPESKRDDDSGRQSLGAHEGPEGKADVTAERFDLVDPPRSPHAAHRVACEDEVAEFFQRGQARGRRVLATLDPVLDAEREVAAYFVVELAWIGTHDFFTLS